MTDPKRRERRLPGSVVQIVNGVFLVAGIVAVAWMIRALGAEDIGAMLASVGGWAAVLLATGLVAILFDARAIHVFMRPEQRMVSYGRVLASQLSGQAVNSVTPTGTLGEVVKATTLLGHAPRYRAISAVLAYNVTSILVKCSMLLVAIAVSLVAADLPAEVDWVLRVAFLVLGTFTLGAMIVIRRGLVRSVAGAARKLRLISPERRERIASRLELFDRQLRVFGPGQESSYTAGVLSVMVARALGWFDLWIMLYATGNQQDGTFIIVAAAAGTIIDMVAGIIPLGIGAEEGGKAGLFALLGPGAVVGLAVSLVNRLRKVAIAVIGLTVFLFVQVMDQVVYRRARRRLVARHSA